MKRRIHRWDGIWDAIPPCPWMWILSKSRPFCADKKNWIFPNSPLQKKKKINIKIKKFMSNKHKTACVLRTKSKTLKNRQKQRQKHGINCCEMFCKNKQKFLQNEITFSFCFFFLGCACPPSYPTWPKDPCNLLLFASAHISLVFQCCPIHLYAPASSNIFKVPIPLYTARCSIWGAFPWLWSLGNQVRSAFLSCLDHLESPPKKVISLFPSSNDHPFHSDPSTLLLISFLQ